jgi:hypothetical protein
MLGTQGREGTLSEFCDFGDEHNRRQVCRCTRHSVVEILNQKLAALVHAPIRPIE